MSLLNLYLKVEEEDHESSMEQEEGDKAQPESNGLDNEDSINLTIGEDEEKLLTEEVGPRAKHHF